MLVVVTAKPGVIIRCVLDGFFALCYYLYIFEALRLVSMCIYNRKPNVI
jgi:hypothetical protein